MTRTSGISPTREGLLPRGSPSQQQFHDDAQRSSSDSDRQLDEPAVHHYPSTPGFFQRAAQRWFGAYHAQEKSLEKRRDRTGKKAAKRGCCSRFRVCFITSGVLLGLFLILSGSGVLWVYKSSPKDGQSPPWYPSPPGGSDKSWEESYRKAAVMVGKMSLVEKVNVTSGTGWSQDLCVGNTAPATEVGFPALCLQDGPLGLRFSDHATAFPAGITVGATWNKDLMYQKGKAHGTQAKLKGINILLGPSMGPLGRMPAGGRNWEGFGPDPVLQGIAASQEIKGIQDAGVIATAKHLVANEQEHFRQSFEWGLPNAMSSNLDDRTMHELYLWPFAESVRAGVASAMCSYNLVNNSYACGNSRLLNGILKDELGFQGFMQSDWLAQRSGVASALAGLDMTMPGDGLIWEDGNSLFGSRLTEAVLNGSIPMTRLNDMVTRVVAAWYQLKQDNQTQWPSPPPEGTGGPNFSSFTDDKIGLIHPGSDDKTKAEVNKFVDVQGKRNSNGKLAKQIASEGTVLVKNDGGILPLSKHGSDKRREAGVKYKVGIFGEDAGPGRGPNVCPDRSCNQGTLGSGWGSGAAEFPYLVTPLEALESTFDPDSVEITSLLSNEIPVKEAPSLLNDQDLCLAFINSDAGEGFEAWNGIRADRNDLFAQKGGDQLVQRVARECGKGKSPTVIVVHAVGPVLLERWIDLPGVRAVILANLPGQESGNALADVLFGDVDASGRLPYTVGKSLSDYGPGGQIMYYPNGVVPQQDFTDRLYIDYRHYDRDNIIPRYEFGFGLSYTTFEFSNLTITEKKPKSALPAARPLSKSTPPSYSTEIPDPKTALFPHGFRKLRKRIYPYIESTSMIKKGKYPYPKGYDQVQPPSPAGGGQGGNPDLYTPHVSVSVDLKNTGTRSGKQVVQVYLSFPDGIIDSSTGDSIDFPIRQLRGFEKRSHYCIKNGNTSSGFFASDMGRIGDGDIHAAFVEFRAKESDKVQPFFSIPTVVQYWHFAHLIPQCLSAQCIYCQSVRAKNTSRQRSHLLECPAYLNAMKEHNPDNPILHEAVNGSPAQHTPTKTPKKRDAETMINGFQATAPQTFPIPKPNLERDFQMSVQLNPKISVGPGIWGQRNWVSFISGHWNGRWGKGTVVPGGQDSQLIAPDLSTHIDANYLLQTHDHPPAFIAVKMDGWRVGPRDVLEKLEDPTQIDDVDPKSYSFRVYVHMETGDARYLHLNTGMWIGSGVRRGTEGKHQQKQCGKSPYKKPGMMKPKQTKSRDGCKTCKSKRLKCDETKPSCDQCRKRHVTCEGYSKEFKWRAFQEATFSTKPIPSPTPANAIVPSWPQTNKRMILPTNTSAADGRSSPDLPAAPDSLQCPEKPVASGLDTHPYERLTMAQLPVSPGSRTRPTSLSMVPHTAYRDQLSFGDSESDLQSSPRCSEIGLDSSQDDWMLNGGNEVSTATSSNATGDQSVIPKQDRHGPADLVMSSFPRYPPLVQESHVFHGQATGPQVHGLPCQGHDPEALTLSSQDASSWQMCVASPSFFQSPLTSTELSHKPSGIYSWPRLSSTSPEMMTLQFDKSTCGILSVKDGPGENPWRTMIWPLAQDSPALYHALISMTAFHNSKNSHLLRIEGITHMKRSLKYLRLEMANKSISVDAALATTLALAFAESWDLHISTGILHLRGAVSLINTAIAQRENRSLSSSQMDNLRFLFSTWVYMDVIARLTSVNVDESDHFSFALDAAIGPQRARYKVDPLMGAAATLFPLIGRVANLVRIVFRSSRNSIKMISHANDLKMAIEAWQPPDAFEAPEDASSDVQHCLDTAEAYRWATLLYLHQAVPEIPSRSAAELAQKVLVYLLMVPVQSRLVIVHIYPLLAAGCEVASNEDRAWVEERWAAMMQRMLIGNLDRCWEVVREVWKRRDTDESQNAGLALRTVYPEQPSRRTSHASGGHDGVHEDMELDDSAPHEDGRVCIQSTQLSSFATQPRSRPLPGFQRSPHEVIEDLDYERTVRGKLHWVGVMKDWKWEILLG
ncbi:MAG: hypothetical protein Q9220_000007 [cf. Caloplaca sp. 1 TL-2023]